MRAVNLLPSDEQGGGRKLPPLPVLAGCIGTVVVTALIAVMFLSASAGVASKQRALEQVQAQYDAIPAPPAPSPVVSQLPQQRQTRVTALATALGQRIAWDRLLREVSEVVPSDVWLVTLNALSPTLAAPTTPATTAQAAAPQGFSVTGCTYSQDSVARFLARLQVVPDLTDMTLAKSESSSDSSTGASGNCPKGMFDFQLAGNVRAAGSAS